MREEKTKIIFALQQIDNISNLIEGNEYERFLISHLIPLKVEFERQLSHLTETSPYTKIKE